MAFLAFSHVFLLGPFLSSDMCIMSVWLGFRLSFTGQLNAWNDSS